MRFYPNYCLELVAQVSVAVFAAIEMRTGTASDFTSFLITDNFLATDLSFKKAKRRELQEVMQHTNLLIFVLSAITFSNSVNRVVGLPKLPSLVEKIAQVHQGGLGTEHPTSPEAFQEIVPV